MFIFLRLGFFLAFAESYCSGLGRLTGDYFGRGVDDVFGVGLGVGLGDGKPKIMSYSSGKN